MYLKSSDSFIRGYPKSFNFCLELSENVVQFPLKIYMFDSKSQKITYNNFTLGIYFAYFGVMRFQFRPV